VFLSPQQTPLQLAASTDGQSSVAGRSGTEDSISVAVGTAAAAVLRTSLLLLGKPGRALLWWQQQHQQEHQGQQQQQAAQPQSSHDFVLKPSGIMSNTHPADAAVVEPPPGLWQAGLEGGQRPPVAD